MISSNSNIDTDGWCSIGSTSESGAGSWPVVVYLFEVVLIVEAVAWIVVVSRRFNRCARVSLAL